MKYLVCEIDSDEMERRRAAAFGFPSPLKTAGTAKACPLLSPMIRSDAPRRRIVQPTSWYD